ncbi:hypothetical protein H4R99_000458 [Coemansia sp. RSA 1722]|nr:hypothetical protein LPJ57_000081 [Coemansia sp. RSA 486]KAJ2221066.1 hypothetical protein IWW45_008963 [Coemansia sp. RSA 485]KAJ2224066.1 hypothetical protein IWW45_008183 [Coemansia sp. RSA 485]KAJ2606250.1 hypothetical protein H4R99_000458 [Coemansia sp. RSA 1722]KAJ2701951.1 hypothetical protein FB645_004483 [Coemansia sp. IMI 203386]
MNCSDISTRQQKLLFQCYCKTKFNTNFFKYVESQHKVVCTRNDKDNYNVNSDEICANYEDYSDCPGVNVSSATSVTLTKVVVLAMVFSSLLLM